MASRANENEEDIAENGDAPLIDLNDANVKKLLAKAKRRGFLTYDELNAALPQDQMSSEQIEDVMSAISEMGVNIVESDEDGEEKEEQEEEVETIDNISENDPRSLTNTIKKTGTGERTDDPVRMYLREMGTVELLSREGEIAIAKRIEAGRETMIAGLCESPLTFQAIIIWRDELNEGRTLLREIIDLETTFAGPEAKVAPQVERPAEIVAQKIDDRQRRMRAAEEDDITNVGGGGLPEEEEEEEDEVNLSLAAMEAELRPAVMATLDLIADTYKKLRKLQDQQVENRMAATGTLSTSQERRYKQLKDELITAVKSLSLNNARIEALVAHLYDINRRLVQN